MTDNEQKVLVGVMLSEIGTAQKYNSLVSELQADIERLRGEARYWRTMYQHNCKEPQWMDISKVTPPDENRQYLLYTTALEGFVWIGRRGPLPKSVTHWMSVPELPPPSLRQDEPASGEP